MLTCFDDSHAIKSAILDGLKEYPMINAKHNPYAIYDALLRVLIWEYDKALWLFRKPVRKIETVRSTIALWTRLMRFRRSVSTS